MISVADVETLLKRIPIEDVVIGDGASLRRPDRATRTAPCPLCGFDGMMVMPKSRVWHCPQCGGGGDAIQWARKVLKHDSFVSAYEYMKSWADARGMK